MNPPDSAMHGGSSCCWSVLQCLSLRRSSFSSSRAALTRSRATQYGFADGCLQTVPFHLASCHATRIVRCWESFIPSIKRWGLKATPASGAMAGWATGARLHTRAIVSEDEPAAYLLQLNSGAASGATHCCVAGYETVGSPTERLMV